MAASPESRQSRVTQLEAHRWQPGQSGNPSGGKRKDELLEDLKARAFEQYRGPDGRMTDKTWARAVAEYQWESAAGHRGPKAANDAAQWIWDRLLGRPAQELRLMGELDEESKMLMAALAAKLQPQLGPVIEAELVEPDAKEGDAR